MVEIYSLHINYSPKIRHDPGPAGPTLQVFNIFLTSYSNIMWNSVSRELFIVGCVLYLHDHNEECWAWGGNVTRPVRLWLFSLVVCSACYSNKSQFEYKMQCTTCFVLSVLNFGFITLQIDGHAIHLLWIVFITASERNVWSPNFLLFVLWIWNL